MTVNTTVRWIDGDAPLELNGGTTWGMPFGRGTVSGADALAVHDAAGQRIASQAWPLATWPDGSLKWAGIALPATQSPSPGYLVTSDADAAPAPAPDTSPGIAVTDAGGTVTVSTGTLEMVMARNGSTLFSTLSRGGTTVARDGRLVSLLQDRVADGPATVTREAFTGEVTAVVVEQSGPVRAVVRLEGKHRADNQASGKRNWLPFVVRFYFYAGARSVRMVHSFIWDGDASQDFLAGLGVRFTVPLEGELHDRHVRIAGADGGFLTEAVRGLTGLRRDPGAEVRRAQIAGEATPPPGEWNEEVSRRLHLIPTWSDYTLSQLSADGFELRKRTAAGHAGWGSRAGPGPPDSAPSATPAAGSAWASRTSGSPTPASWTSAVPPADEASLTAWLYSPEAQPMDLRFYHDGLGQDTFEDQLEGSGDHVRGLRARLREPHRHCPHT